MGYTLNGFYLVKGKDNKIEFVYCNFNHYSDGFESRLGVVDVKTSPVQFYVQRKDSYWTEKGSVIPWQIEVLNIGNAMNLATGLFTAPQDGYYKFTFSEDYNKSSQVSLRLNGQNVETALSYNNQDSASLHSTVGMKKGDQVDLYLNQKGSYDGSHGWSHFTGRLDDQDLPI